MLAPLGNAFIRTAAQTREEDRLRAIVRQVASQSLSYEKEKAINHACREERVNFGSIEAITIRGSRGVGVLS